MTNDYCFLSVVLRIRRDVNRARMLSRPRIFPWPADARALQVYSRRLFPVIRTDRVRFARQRRPFEHTVWAARLRLPAHDERTHDVFASGLFRSGPAERRPVTSRLINAMPGEKRIPMTVSVFSLRSPSFTGKGETTTSGHCDQVVRRCYAFCRTQRFHLENARSAAPL